MGDEMQCPRCGFVPTAVELYRLADPQFGDRVRWVNDAEHLKTLEFYAWFLAGFPDARVLDLGSGPGTVGVPLCRLESVREITCYDVDPAARASLEAAKQSYGLGKLTVTGSAGQPHSLPYDDGTFDAVICRYSMHHFPDQPLAMHEIARCLRPGGLVLYSDPAMPPHSRDATDPLYRRREATFSGYRTYHEMIDLLTNSGLPCLCARPYDYQRGTLGDYLEKQAEPLKSELIEAWLALDETTKKEMRWSGRRDGPFITYPVMDLVGIKQQQG